MSKEEVIAKIKELTGCKYVKLATRGNTAIDAAVSGKILIPEEGGWLHYQKFDHDTVKCNDGKIDLDDLKKKLATGKYHAFLYQNPGGYFAEEPIQEIYKICKENNCLVVLDVSGSLGTELCDGDYADIIVGSFGRWKPVNAEVGGFVASNDRSLFRKVEKNIKELKEESSLKIILEKLNGLQERLKFLTDKRKQVINDLKDFDIVHKDDFGLVVVVKFSTDKEKESNKTTSRFKLSEKESIINYCKNNNLPWTECPRYIRLNKKAVSIEVKKL